MEYNGDEKRSQANAALRILIDLNKQTHKCVKSLEGDLSRNSAKTVSNGVKIDGVLEFNIKCDKRMTTLELWKAGHVGEGKGRDKLSTSIGTKITLYCVIGTLVIAGLAFYYTSVKPTLEMSIGAYNKIVAIEKTSQELF